MSLASSRLQYGSLGSHDIRHMSIIVSAAKANHAFSSIMQSKEAPMFEEKRLVRYGLYVYMHALVCHGQLFYMFSLNILLRSVGLSPCTLPLSNL